MNNDRNITFMCILVILFASCAPSQSSIQTAIAQTEIANSTATALFVESFRSQIEASLFQPGDLPNNWTNGPITTDLPDGPLYDILPTADLTTNEPIINTTYDRAGFILVLFYTNSSDLEKAYSGLFVGTLIPDFAEKAKSMTVGETGEWNDVAFVRCSTIVFIKIYGLYKSDIIDYAIRLDRRLINAICK